MGPLIEAMGLLSSGTKQKEDHLTILISLCIPKTGSKMGFLKYFYEFFENFIQWNLSALTLPHPVLSLPPSSPSHLFPPNFETTWFPAPHPHPMESLCVAKLVLGMRNALVRGLPARDHLIRK